MRHQELLENSENAYPRQSGSRFQPVREEGYTERKDVLTLNLGSLTLKSRPLVVFESSYRSVWPPDPTQKETCNQPR